EREAAIGIRRGERLKVGAPREFFRGDAVDRGDLGDRQPTAGVESGAGIDEVAAAEGVLPQDMRRNERVGGCGEVAVERLADVAGVAGEVEPSVDDLIDNDGCGWRSAVRASGCPAAL